MPYIGLQDLLRGFGQLTPEQAIFINWFYSRFDSHAAANRQIINVEPLFSKGVLTGACVEFLTYAATKLYLCLDMVLSISHPLFLVPLINQFYDETNVVDFYYFNESMIYNTVGATQNYFGNSLHLSNLYFSRIGGDYEVIKFIGYRITLV